VAVSVAVAVSTAIYELNPYQRGDRLCDLPNSRRNHMKYPGILDENLMPERIALLSSTGDAFLDSSPRHQRAVGLTQLRLLRKRADKLNNDMTDLFAILSRDDVAELSDTADVYATIINAALDEKTDEC
jgi:hypothetical protein